MSRDTSYRCRTRHSSRCWARSGRARRGTRFSTTPGTAPNTAMRTTRGPSSRGLRSCARSAQSLLGFPNHAAWQLKDQMAKTPENALDFLNTLVPLATARAVREGKDIQAVIDAQHGGFTLEAWDWDFYAEQVRKAKYNLDDAEVKPYFELNNVLENGVFYAANQLYGITFKERKDIPVYQPDVRVFDVIDADGKPLALFYCDYFKRDNKQGGAWMSNFRRSIEVARHATGDLQRRQFAEAGARPACAHQLRRCHHDVPRIRPRTARHVRRHGISEYFRHRDGARFRRISLAIQRALGYLSGGLRSLCASL